MSNPNTNSKLKTLCRTAIFLALLVAVQFVTRSMGQYVTGSLVNLILIASGLLCGLWGGLAVALLSPVCAFLIGIGPAFPQIVPAIMLGNAVIVLVWHLIAGGEGICWQPPRALWPNLRCCIWSSSSGWSRWC